MNQTSAYCPQCGNVVRFLKAAGTARCPVCGFQYQLSAATREKPPVASLPGMGILKAILLVFFVMLVVAAVLVGIIFVGCAQLFRNV